MILWQTATSFVGLWWFWLIYAYVLLNIEDHFASNRFSFMSSSLLSFLESVWSLGLKDSDGYMDMYVSLRQFFDKKSTQQSQEKAINLGLWPSQQLKRCWKVKPLTSPLKLIQFGNPRADAHLSHGSVSGYQREWARVNHQHFNHSAIQIVVI